MTDAVLLTIAAAASATVILAGASLAMSKRSAARIDRLVAERASADRSKLEASIKGPGLAPSAARPEGA
ncbi:hypothetical protein MKK75_01895 [Methylobacterium sp. J-030]|uniref:hypothetical protein n=1 Tax=Methylobacterium sp. J-030 TaxID=2836627 RepID=UPI001FB86D59|nr:hypothetical protein [Methylobacterium sp. J-030]MCJ2067565.1 hypothetical protein [Methylobacterium sp. J-030]